MRSEQAILELLVNTAQNDDRIRAAMLNGSRVNPNARRDIFQDFDVVYFVTEVDSFKADPGWIDRFGERMILQMPEAMEDPPPMNDGHFAYLIQFADGNRIDLTLFPIDRLAAFEQESLSLLLLDKDGLIGPLPPPNESDYLPKPPSAKAFADCCNEFWWVCTYVAKGLWREEILYAKTTVEEAVRPQLMKMLTWQIGIDSGFTRSPGKLGKYFKQQLASDRWALLEQTYADASYENSWDALFTMCVLFRQTAQQVADHFGFAYPYRDDANVSAHLHHVRTLPKQATAIY